MTSVRSLHSGAQPFISLDNIAIRLPDKILFEGLCWEIFSDQHWAIVGPNGSGKSVLMRALCGSVPVVRGQVMYHFLNDAAQHAAIQDQIAYVAFESQRTVLGDEAFYQERWNSGIDEDACSVQEYLSQRAIQTVNPYQVFEKHSDETFEKRQQDVIDQLDLTSLLERKVIQLSNGERRKISIARALLKNPKLLILDNPFAGLDEDYRAKLGANLEKLMQGSLRVMFVGMHRDEIPESITHMLCVKEGRAIAQGPRQLILKDETLTSIHPGSQLVGISAAITCQKQKEHESTSPVLVSIANANVSYNGTQVLHQVSWTVREDERWALLGPNGAGKTTLLSLILADNPQAYANDITLFGNRRGSGESIWEIKRNIGWVAPELHLYYPRGATTLAVVCSGWFDSVGLYRHCSAKQSEIAQEWLMQLGLAGCAEKAFAQISEGEQRLALIARALVKSPTLLVLDEPCQGLDDNNRDCVLQAIDRVGRRPHTSMIYVTHRADELPQNITHVLRINAGRVVDPAPQRK
jgi:molybdate transport system ATP-binding protein